MPSQRLLTAPLDLALGSQEVHSCRECERHIAVAERELGALVTAGRDLFGNAKATHVQKNCAQDKSSIKKGINVPHPISDIVIADDNPAILGILAEIFSEQGHSVRTACDGFAALEAIRERAPDILLSDLNMPRMSGSELLEIVRCRFPQIAAIA